jgi:integrase
MERIRRERLAVGNAYLFPAPESEGHIRVDVARRWLLQAERLAKIEHQPGFGFHALRRRWATKRKHLSAKDVAACGGWKNTATLQQVYQFPDPQTMQEVVLEDRTLRLGTDG